MAKLRGRSTAAIIVATVTALAGLVVTNREAGQLWSEIPATQQIRYNVAPAGWENWGPGRSLPATLVETRQRLERHQGQGFVIKQRNSMEWSRARTLGDTIEVLNQKLQGPLDVVWLVMAVVDEFRLKLRGHDWNPAAYFNHPDGTLAVDIIIGTLMKRHPGLSIGGVYVCRPIAGSNTLSQHSYGNAVDTFGTTAEMRTAAYDLLDLGRAGYVPVSQILWDHQNLFTGHYVYDHTNHVHFSGDPLMSGGCRRP